MDIELYNKYILCAYEAGSLTGAGKVLGISQPALSAGLSSLEKKLGFKVFDRKCTPLQLTKEGKIYLEYLHRQKKIAEDYQRKIDEIHNPAGGRITIGGPTVYVESLIVKGVADFQPDYPECTIVIKDAPVPELIEKTKEGEIDCFVSTSHDLPQDFAREEIKKERIYLCIPGKWEINTRLAEYQTAVGETGNCFDYSILSGLPFISLEENQPLQKEIRKFFMANHIFPKNYLTVNQVPAGIALCALGLGISFASEEALLGCGRLESLCTYSMPDNISGRKIYIAYSKNNYMPYTCRQLIKKIQNIC